MKQQFSSVSARAIRVAFHYSRKFISFIELHCMAKRATPEMFRMYKLSLLLYHTFNEQILFEDWQALNFDQYNTISKTSFNIIKK